MSDDRLSGSRILVVEDEYYVADELRVFLQDAGVTMVGPVPTVEQAHAALAEHEGVDAVLLDVNLRGDMAYDLADSLKARNVPFAFVTGYDRSALPQRFANDFAATKPLQAEQLGRLVTTLLASTA